MFYLFEEEEIKYKEGREDDDMVSSQGLCKNAV